MANDQAKPSGPDLTKGLPFSDLADGGMIVGHVGKDEVLVVRQGDNVFAVDAHCTHYHGPLGDGLVVGETVRCPWHHACFDLRTGEALRAPAVSPLSCWNVERKGASVIIRTRKEKSEPRPRGKITSPPDKIVIIGGGAAGFAAAEMLRRQKFEGSITLLSNDEAPPVDRPNLSKDYLAGTAPEEWVPLRETTYYKDNNIDLRLRADVVEIDRKQRQVLLRSGDRVAYNKLLLATGAEPIRLPLPGFDAPIVHTLRSLDDCRQIIAAARDSRRVVVIGASFIGLEVAAALRQREIETHVAAPEKRPMERVLGPEMGDFIRKLHEEHGVQFHLDDPVVAIEAKQIKLQSGAVLEADLVIAGVGVKPRVELAEKAGLAIDRGVKVDAYLQTSDPNIYAAGDIARWPDPHSGADIRVEHWVVAERQGQTAALNMIGIKEKFDQVPFFWSQHYDVPINYVGHAEGWDEIAVEGDIGAKDCLLRFKKDGRTLAAASIYRDVDSLAAEVELEMAQA
ncbi:MAG: Rieske 2Fe-2S domain-containing protein [Alphaproteobacteria bacterium]|nr:Rieske 2Fe-2S domain-containing protein [Alphaproteobacteria bacterium]